MPALLPTNRRRSSQLLKLGYQSTSAWYWYDQNKTASVPLYWLERMGIASTNRCCLLAVLTHDIQEAKRQVAISLCLRHHTTAAMISATALRIRLYQVKVTVAPIRLPHPKSGMKMTKPSLVAHTSGALPYLHGCAAS